MSQNSLFWNQAYTNTSSQELQVSRAPQPRRKAVESSAAHCTFRPSTTMLSVKNRCGSLVQVDRTATFCKCPFGMACMKEKQKLYAGRHCKSGGQILWRPWKAGEKPLFQDTGALGQSREEEIRSGTFQKISFFSGSKEEEWAWN